MKNEFVELLDKYFSSITDEKRLYLLKKNIKILKKQYKEIKDDKYFLKNYKSYIIFVKNNLRKILSDYYLFIK